MDSILISIKKLLGIEAEYTHFDPDIIMAINSAMMALSQLGIGTGYSLLITGNLETWSSFLSNRDDLEAVKSYVYLKTRLMFDPPGNSFLIEAIKDQIKELEWRINVQAEATITLVETPTAEGGTV
jgi:hypothetical protein